MPLSFGDRAVEAVVFDLDDVLVPFQTVHAWQWAWRPQGPVLGERRATAAIRTRLRAWDRRRWQGLTGQAPPADLEALREHLSETLRTIAGHALPPEETAAVVRRFLKPASEIERYPDAAATLAALARDGAKVGVLTYLPSETARWLLKRAGIDESLLLGTGDSSGPVVPDGAAFRAAVQKLDVPASRTVFVGDLLWSDVRAANRAGLLPILLDRHDAWPNVQADRAASLSAVGPLLRSGASSPPAASAPSPPPPAP